MKTQQKLDPSSPIVRRVLCLRACMVQRGGEAETELPLAEKRPDSVDAAQTRKSYQWQMWQKSDFSAYAEEISGYRCKG